MDTSLVKLTIKSAEDSLPAVITKFMTWRTITLEDLCWWWNPNKRWGLNRKYAENALRILIKEKCLKPLTVEWLYVKTEPFVSLLLELMDEEDLLNKCGIETYQEYITDIPWIPGLETKGHIGFLKFWYQSLWPNMNTPELIEYRNTDGEIVRVDKRILG